MFADPMYEVSPIAHILNYRTIVIYYMPHLSTLDSFAVSENEIKNAEVRSIQKYSYSRYILLFHLINDTFDK